MSKTNFLWAQDENANVREPIRELAEKGWQHRDIPKASNMNWIFKQISDEFTALRKDMEQKTDEIKSMLAVQSNELQKQQEVLGTLKTELGTLSENHSSFKVYAKRNLAKAFRADDFNTGIARTMCELLREMERLIRHYHHDFPNLPWPLTNRSEATINTTAEDESID